MKVNTKVGHLPSSVFRVTTVLKVNKLCNVFSSNTYSIPQHKYYINFNYILLYFAFLYIHYNYSVFIFLSVKNADLHIMSRHDEYNRSLSLM